MTLCLMGACRQLHDETNLSYATNLFQDRPGEIVKFIARLGAGADYMRAVRIDARYAISDGVKFTEVLDLALYDLQELHRMSQIVVQTRWTGFSIHDVIVRNLKQTRPSSREGQGVKCVLERKL